MIGLVHFPRSPRHVDLATADWLAEMVRGRVKIVCLLVDPKDELLDKVFSGQQPDYFQLHGAETPARVAEISERWQVPVIKAIKVANAADAAMADAYRSVAKLILFDAKVNEADAGTLPGGNGVAFDWRAIAGTADKGPFMLSGGLNPGNVATAIRLTGAPIMDVSSGVESAPGIKDVTLIARFIAAARGLATS